MWFLTLILGAVILYLINYWVNSHFENWKRQGIYPSKSSSPFKLLFNFLFTKKGLLELMKEEYSKCDGHRFVGYFQMFTPGIMIRDPDLVHQICIKDFSHFIDRTLPSEVSDFFTENISGLTGDKWRTLRHKLTPTFTSGKLKMMFQPIQECCDEVVDYINEKLGHDINAREFMFKYSINVIGKVSFGMKIDALNEATEKDNEFLKISRSFFKPSVMLIVKFMISMTMPKLRKYIKFSMINEGIDKFFRKLTKDLIEHRERTGEVRNDFLQLMLDQKRKEQSDSRTDSLYESKINSHQSDEPEDNELLDQLKYMQGGNDNYKTAKVFTDDCIVSQVFVFISGGSETIASSLSFVFYELATNPSCQKTLQGEIDDVISKYGFTYNAIRNMKYADQVIHETLRLHTGAPFLSRICTQNYKIPDSDVILEKGTFIGIPVNGINYDPQIFPNPQKFDPDRYKDMDAVNPGVLLSFGIGPRMCIAKRLAVLEIKMLLAAIFHKFDVVLSSKTKTPIRIMKSSVFQHVDGGIWIRFQERK